MPHERLAAELLAVADALRTARSQIGQLVHEKHPAAAGQQEARIVLQEAHRLAAALETLAERLGVQP